MNFREYAKSKIKLSDNIIEFGPLIRPLFKKNEFNNIYYADIRSTEDIIKLYSGNDYMQKTGIKVDTNKIVNIDYVINGTYKETFKNKKFNVAYLSHVIEHMPNIIEFFIEINEVLFNNAKLIIIYPDKRYCFDHFRNEVSFRDAYATYKYGVKENSRLTFDFAYNVVHENDPYFFWKSEKTSKIISKNTIRNAEEYYEDTLNNKKIDDVHIWPFSDLGFLKFIYEMQRANLMNFEIEEFFPTQENTQEFMIILKKVKKHPNCSMTLDLIDKYDFNYNYILNVKQELKKLQKSLFELTKENNNLIKREAELRYEIISIENSKSMRITKPLRNMAKLLKKGDKHHEK